VNTDDDAEDYKKKIKSFGVSWIDAWGGMDICREFGVSSFPTIAILDETGRVAAMNARGAALERAVESTLRAMRARQQAKGNGRGQ
jgi:hypothetical protein